MMTGALLLAALCSAPNVFFAVVENYTVDGGRVNLQLSHPMVVHGKIPSRVSVDPKQIAIKPAARHVFFTDDDGVVATCSHAIKTAEFAARWKELTKSTGAPALPIAAVESNFCSRATRKSVTLYDDGTIVIGGVAKRVSREQLEEIRRLLKLPPPRDEPVGWLSYVPPGMQELTMYVDDGETWSGGPSYSKCGAARNSDTGYVTPHRAKIVRAILIAAGDPEAFEGCGCVADE